MDLGTGVSGWDQLPGWTELCASREPLSIVMGTWSLEGLGAAAGQWDEAGNEALIPGGVEEFPLARGAIRMGSLLPSLPPSTTWTIS